MGFEALPRRQGSPKSPRKRRRIAPHLPWGSKPSTAAGFSEEPEEEEEESPPIPDEMPVESDISSIDSLADSLSLLEDEWEPDSDVVPHDPFESNISSEQNQWPTGSTDQEINNQN